jgi:hypothetical protein
VNGSWGSTTGVSVATGNSRPQPDIRVPNLPALKLTLGPDGDLSPTIFDKHGAHLPT